MIRSTGISNLKFFGFVGATALSKNNHSLTTMATSPIMHAMKISRIDDYVPFPNVPSELTPNEAENDGKAAVDDDGDDGADADANEDVDEE